MSVGNGPGARSTGTAPDQGTTSPDSNLTRGDKADGGREQTSVHPEEPSGREDQRGLLDGTRRGPAQPAS